MRELTRGENVCFVAGAVLMLVGLVLFVVHPRLSLYTYGTGTLLFVLMQLRAEYLGRSFVLRRLRRQQLFACCLFVVTLALLSMQVLEWGPFRRQEWVVALTIAAVLELYTSFRIPNELSKEQKGK